MLKNNNINERQKELAEKLEKQIEFERPFNVAKYQHKLAQNLLKEQHKLNLEIHEKQAKLTKITTCIMAVVTIFAVLIGTGLGWYLAKLKLLPPALQSQKDKELQKKLDQEAVFEESQARHKKEIE